MSILDAGETTPEETTAILARTATFGVLREDQLAWLVSTSPVLRAGPGVEVFAQGEIGRYAFLVLEGTVSVEVDTELGRVAVAKLGRGDLVGEIGAFAATPRTATVRSETGVALLRIGQEAIQSLLADNPQTAMAIIGELGQRLQSLNGTIASLTQATRALALDEFRPEMLDMLRRQADRFAHFADTFDEVATEIRRKRMLTLEMSAAAQIQKAFLPRRVDAGKHAGAFEISAAMTAATHVGGDFYDYFMVDPDTVAIAIGDVSGKGVPAALFMSMCRTILRTVARQNLSPSRTLAEANAQLVDGNSEAMFVTIAFAHLHLPTGRLACASGGHEEVFLVSGAGAVEQLSPTGPALGLIDGVTFDEHETRLAPLSHVVLATDGITEAFNPEGAAFGLPRFVEALSANAGEPAEAMVRNVSVAVRDFVAGHPQSDDLTGLALRYLGPS